MRNLKKIGVLSASLFIFAFVLFSLHAKANIVAKKQIEVCTVTQGGEIVQVGNKCVNGGTGCIPNPCGQ